MANFRIYESGYELYQGLEEHSFEGRVIWISETEIGDSRSNVGI
jgi:hypothetical protein